MAILAATRPRVIHQRKAQSMYRHFTEGERYTIYENLHMNQSKQEIADHLGKHISSVYRELKRNTGEKNYRNQSKQEIADRLGKHISSVYRELKRNTGQRKYRPKQANDKAVARQAHKPRLLRFTASIRAHVEAWLKEDFSPEQIVGRAEREGIAMVSHERIYEHVLADKRAGGTLYTHLRHAPKKYRKRYGSTEKRGQIPNKVSIEHRPPEVATRKEMGHWEIDTVIGKSHDGAIVTLVERTSRFTVIGKLIGKHAEPCAEKTIELLTPFSDKVKSITADNGTEFAKVEHIAGTLEALFFFAHPYHSWERGSNENTNGLIRQYLPKSMGFEFLTQEDCQKIMDKLNNRPRKVLGFRTPAEVFFSKDVQLSHL
ncbi:MAG: IS30 family transposase [Candidatus Kapaibacterium sp.]|nr:MAG: IS30 family transposase [Candidatus Kapabacteria bacterium]